MDKNKRKSILLSLFAVIVSIILVACGTGDNNEEETATGEDGDKAEIILVLLGLRPET